MSLNQLKRSLNRLRRLRWLVGIGVVSGIAVSIAINVLHAPDNRWARVIAGVPPLAVYAILEFISHIPSSSRWLSIVRIAGATIVAGGAAYLSYAQQYAAIVALGFPLDQARIWPAVIDGTMVVASVSLVEVLRKARQIQAQVDEATDSDPSVRRLRLEVQESPEVLQYRRAHERLRATGELPEASNGKVR
jgi:hypothetical protein